MKQKKAITPVVATALLLVVAVVAVMGFQNWFNTYQTNLNTNLEGQSNNLQNSIEITNVIGNNLYLKSSSNITLSDIKINSRDCKLSPQLTAGMNVIDIGSCISGLNSDNLDVTIIGNTSVKSKTFYTDSTTQKEFVKLLGDANALSIIQTSNGGFAIAGNEYNGTTHKVLLVKTDSLGNEIWNKTFSFSGYNSFGNSIIQTSNGGFAIAGREWNSTNYNALIIKTDDLGNEIWNKTFSFNGSRIFVLSMIQTSDKGFVMTGYKYNLSSTNSNLLVIKTNSLGNEVWNKTFIFNGSKSFGKSIMQTKDGGLIIGGYKTNITTNNYNVLLIKTNSSGNELWNKTFSFNGYKSRGNSIIQTSEGGFAITGYKQNTTSSNWNALLIKTNSSGNEIWNKTFIFNGYESLSNSIIQTSNGGLAITGYGYNPSNSNYNALLFKTNSSGNEVWNKTFSFNGSRSYGSSIIQTSDGGFAIAGHEYNGTTNKVLLIKTDSNGNTCDYNATGQC